MKLKCPNCKEYFDTKADNADENEVFNKTSEELLKWFEEVQPFIKGYEREEK